MPPSKTKCITIYSNTAESKINFKNDISSKRIYDKLNKKLHVDPNIIQTYLRKKLLTRWKHTCKRKQ